MRRTSGKYLVECAAEQVDIGLYWLSVNETVGGSR
jgi:hypothetical protein